VKWNPLPMLKALSTLAYQSAAERVAASFLFAAIVLAVGAVGAAVLGLVELIRRLMLLPLILAGLSLCTACAPEGVALPGPADASADTGAAWSAPYRGPGLLRDAAQDDLTVRHPDDIQPDVRHPDDIQPDTNTAGGADVKPPACPALLPIVADCGTVAGWHCERTDDPRAPCQDAPTSRWYVTDCGLCPGGAP
jgi:hypothetical protein